MSEWGLGGWVGGGIGRCGECARPCTRTKRVKQPVIRGGGDLLCVQDVEWRSSMVCCYTAWGLDSTWVLIGPLRSQQPTPPPPLPCTHTHAHTRSLAQPLCVPLLPQGFSVHILPADYHHYQSWLLHSSCCPHSGSGANLTRLHGERKLSHAASGRQSGWTSSFQPPAVPFASCGSLHQRCSAILAAKKEEKVSHWAKHDMPFCQAPAPAPQLNNIQSWKLEQSRSPTYLEAFHQGGGITIRRGGLVAGPSCVGLSGVSSVAL